LDNRREYERALKDVVRFLGEAAENDERRIAEGVEQHKAKTDEEPDAEAMRRIQAKDCASAEARAERARHLVKIGALIDDGSAGQAQSRRWVGRGLHPKRREAGPLRLTPGDRGPLAERFGAPKITGDTPAEERQAVVERFQKDPATRLLVCNVRAGGVGLTLTAASNVAFCELGWTPAEHDQAEDRCHRIGQRGSVGAWYLLAKDTIDTEIHALIEKKQATVNVATEGVAETGNAVFSDLKVLLAKRVGSQEG
jgi:hypothetical protein